MKRRMLAILKSLALNNFDIKDNSSPPKNNNKLKTKQSTTKQSSQHQNNLYLESDQRLTP